MSDLFNMFKGTDSDQLDVSSRIEDGNGGGIKLPTEHVETETGRPKSRIENSWEVSGRF